MCAGRGAPNPTGTLVLRTLLVLALCISSSGCSFISFQMSFVINTCFVTVNKLVSRVVSATPANSQTQGGVCGNFWLVAKLDRSCGSTGDLLLGKGWSGRESCGTGSLACGISTTFGKGQKWIVGHPAGVRELVGGGKVHIAGVRSEVLSGVLSESVKGKRKSFS